MESIVKVPSVAGDMDFLAFSFNGKHSWDDFGIIRASDGDRYNENLVPAMQDKTAEVPGGDGMYYFGTTHKQRDFNISIAFDNMSEVKYREMRQWLNGKEMGDLWFSEAPYKVYTVKPTGTPSLKTLCFDRYNEATGYNERVYKGEGTIQFTAYWPYAHTPDWVLKERFDTIASEPIILSEPVTAEILKLEGFKGQELFIIRHDGNLLGPLPVVEEICVITGGTAIEIHGLQTQADENFYLYIKNDEIFSPIPFWKKDGKIYDSYILFDNAKQWENTANLCKDLDGVSVNCGENPGDIPAPFIVQSDGEISSGDSFLVGETSIEIGDTTYVKKELQWDSKSGIVSALVSAPDGTLKRQLIPYTGNSFGVIPVGGLSPDEINTDYATLKYHYWYY